MGTYLIMSRSRFSPRVRFLKRSPFYIGSKPLFQGPIYVLMFIFSVSIRLSVSDGEPNFYFLRKKKTWCQIDYKMSVCLLTFRVLFYKTIIKHYFLMFFFKIYFVNDRISFVMCLKVLHLKKYRNCFHIAHLLCKVGEI